MSTALQFQLDEEKSLEIMGEYLAAFLATEQDWSVIDGLMHARNLEEALEHYDVALRSIHRVLNERGGWIHSNLVHQLNRNIDLRNAIDDASRNVRKMLESQKFKSNSLKLVERALAKYPKYREIERREEQQEREEQA